MPHSIEQPITQPEQPRLQRIRRTPTQWAELVTDWEHSGMSQKAFCELKGLCYRNFCQWKSRLKNGSRISEPLTPQSPAFMPVQINAGKPSLASLSPAELEIHLPSTLKLTLRSDLASMTSLIKELASVSC